MEVRRLEDTSALQPLRCQLRKGLRPPVFSQSHGQKHRRAHPLGRLSLQCRVAAVQFGSTALPAAQPAATVHLEGKVKVVGETYAWIEDYFSANRSVTFLAILLLLQLQGRILFSGSHNARMLARDGSSSNEFYILALQVHSSPALDAR